MQNSLIQNFGYSHPNRAQNPVRLLISVSAQPRTRRVAVTDSPRPLRLSEPWPLLPNPRPRRGGHPWTRRRCWWFTAATGAGCSASSSPPAAGAAARSTSPASTSTPSAPTTRSSASPPVRLPEPAPSVPAWRVRFDRWGALGVFISHLTVRVLINPGAQFDASEATRRYFDERRYPIMVCAIWSLEFSSPFRLVAVFLVACWIIAVGSEISRFLWR